MYVREWKITCSNLATEASKSRRRVPAGNTNKVTFKLNMGSTNYNA